MEYGGLTRGWFGQQENNKRKWVLLKDDFQAAYLETTGKKSVTCMIAKSIVGKKTGYLMAQRVFIFLI